MTVEVISSPPVLAAGNWVWLLAPPRQERAVVRVAEAVGIPYALSTLGTTSIEDVAAAAPTARK